MIIEGHTCFLSESIYPVDKTKCRIISFHGKQLFIEINKPIDENFIFTLESNPLCSLIYNDENKFMAYKGMLKVYSLEQKLLIFNGVDKFISNNRRKYSRANLAFQVTVDTHDEQGELTHRWSGNSVDISASGIKVFDKKAIVAGPYIKTTVKCCHHIFEGITNIAWQNDKYTGLDIKFDVESKMLIGGFIAGWHKHKLSQSVLA